MRYTYSVKVNGKWYRPNTEVPENNVDVVDNTKKLSSAPVEKKPIEKAVKKTAKKA